MTIVKNCFRTFLLIVVISLSAANENARAQSVVLEKSFVVKDYNVKISFPQKWRVETKNKNPFDLQCTNGDSFASVFVFYKVDLAEGQTPQDIFHTQNEDLINKRENVKIINEEKTEMIADKQIRTMLFSAEKEGTKNYYYCNLIEFGEASDRFVWILFAAYPSYALANIETMKKIVASTVLLKK